MYKIRLNVLLLIIMVSSSCYSQSYIETPKEKQMEWGYQEKNGANKIESVTIYNDYLNLHNDSTLVSKYEFTYYKSGLLKSKISYERDNDYNSWIPLRKFEYTYNTRGEIETSIESGHYNLSTERWIEMFKFHYTYDSENRLIKEEKFNNEYDNTSWDIRYWKDYSYDYTGCDKIITKEPAGGSDGIPLYKVTYKVEFNYRIIGGSSNNYYEVIESDGKATNTHFYSKYKYNLADGRDINRPDERIEYYWNTNDENNPKWIERHKIIYEYSHGVGALQYNRTPANSWELTAEYHKYYNEYLNKYAVKYGYWVKEVFYRDDNGNIIFSESYSNANRTNYSERYFYKIWENPSLSTNNIEKIDLCAHPNPTTGEIRINSDVEISSIEVYNQLGQLVLSNFRKQSIDMSNLSSGIYIVKTTDKEGTSRTRKIIKK